VAQLVIAAPKYNAIDAGLVTAITAKEVPKAGNEVDAIKRVKRKLHQLVGAYLDASLPFEAWLGALKTAADARARLDICRDILAHHASTRERLPELDEFYAAVFAGVSPRVVADLACGLNPLARGLMPLPADAEYVACDVHRPLVEFVGAALELLGFPGRSFVCDLLAAEPLVDADVVLVLKTLPCLEQAAKGAARQVLDRIRAPLIVVSYPTASLGGARRGMENFYETQFMRMLPPRRFEVEILRFRSELVFRLWRRSDAARAD
jgi:16S rRNA (guanine(1405)-N(7))-methyltransferase